MVTQLLFRQAQPPNLKDFSFNERTEKAMRHVLTQLKKDYLSNTDGSLGAANDSKAKKSPGPATPKGKRKAIATDKAASSAKRVKKAAKAETEDSEGNPDAEGDGIKAEPDDNSDDYDNEA
jgi:hypothetical protein